MRRRIGSGGQGSVYVGVDRDDREVAIKVMSFANLDRAASQLRFLKEAKLVKTLRHPNLVAVLDYGVTDDGCYLVMELLRGQPLTKRLDELGAPNARVDATPDDVTRRLPETQLDRLRQVSAGNTALTHERLRQRDHWRFTVKTAIALCHGLSRLHAAGVVHRDIKPANVVIEDDGRVVLVDLSLVTAGDLPANPGANDFGGTHGYMGLEQRLGKTVTPRSDIYSLGCTLYACLLGSPPSMASSTAEQRVVTMMTANPAIPETLARTVARCLELEPLDRYPSVDDLRADLEAVLAGKALGWRKRRRSMGWSAAVASVSALALLAWSMRGPETLQTLVARGDVVALTERLRDPSGDPGSVRAKLTNLLANTAPTDVPTVVTLASVLGLGVVEVAASTHHTVHVAPSDLELSDPMPGLDEFVALHQSVALAVQVGLVAVRIHDTRPGSRWSMGHPLVFQLLRQIETAPSRATIDPVVLPGLARNQSALGAEVAWSVIEAGSYAFTIAPGTAELAPSQLTLVSDLAVASVECSFSCVIAYLSWMQHKPGLHDDIFKHPLEPEDTELASIRVADDQEPTAVALVSFWLAFRVAGFVGARLASAAEWSAIAGLCYPDGGPPKESWVAHVLQQGAVLSPQVAPDKFGNERGILHFLDNAREWVSTLDHASSPWIGWAPLWYVVTRTHNVAIRTHRLVTVSMCDRMPLRLDSRAGIRLVRDIPRR